MGLLIAKKMKFTCKVDVHLPIEKVVELWDNPDNLVKWQDNFLRIEPLTGDPGETEARSRIYYKQGRGEMELLETIMVKDLPHEMIAMYEHKSMVNIMTNRFKELDGQTTRWEAEVEYTRFIGLIPNIMARFFPRMFEKQVQKWLDQFKAFAEGAVSK